jgi:hypothetical protein
MNTTDPIIEYKNLLNKYGDLEAPKVKAFYDKHAAQDQKFVKRAKVLTELVLLKRQLVTAE